MLCKFGNNPTPPHCNSDFATENIIRPGGRFRFARTIPLAELREVELLKPPTKLLALVVLLAGLAFGQAPAPLTGSMFIATGVVYDHYVATPGYANTIDFGIQVPNSNFWSVSTMVLQPNVATMRTGAAYLLKRAGPFSVFATADAGVSSVAGTGPLAPSPLFSVGGLTLGNVGGGVLFRFDLGSVNKKLTGLGIVTGFRETAVAGTSIAPEFILKMGFFLK